MAILSVLSMSPAELRQAERFVLVPVKDQHIRISVYEQPQPDHRYALGFDAALGVIGRDDDAICVMDKDTTPNRQVAEIQGKIGERLDRIVYATAMFYNGAFIVGERQVGLPTLRRLHDEYRYGWLYFERDEKRRGRRHIDALGHPRVHDDVHMRQFRSDSMDRKFVLRSPALIDQMSRTEFRERSRAMADAERREDETLIIKLAGGGSPDLVMGAVYSWLGIREMERFEKPRDQQQVALEQYLGEFDEPTPALRRR